jgi:hypothetical protein
LHLIAVVVTMLCSSLRPRMLVTSEMLSSKCSRSKEQGSIKHSSATLVDDACLLVRCSHTCCLHTACRAYDGESDIPKAFRARMASISKAQTQPKQRSLRGMF